MPPIHWLLPVSIPAAAVVLFFALKGLAGRADISAKFVIGALKSISVPRYLAVAVLIVAYVKLRKLSSGDWSNVGMEPALYVLQGTTRPLEFLTGHAATFGPLFITLCLVYRQFCKQVQKLGLGIYLLIGAATLYSLNGESRQLTNVVPFVVVALILALNRMPLRKHFLATTFIVSLIVSRGWLPITSLAGKLGATAETMLQPGHMDSLPSQLFLMSSGPHSSNFFWALWSIVFLCLVPVMWPLATPCPTSERQGS
jgi:hypothetical protein